jgi:hypothetical protein
MSKQEIFEAYCSYCAEPAEDEHPPGLLADMRRRTLAAQFEFFYDFFKAYMQQSPDSN